MTHTLTVDLAAWSELEAAITWYDEQVPDRTLGLRLSLAFEDALEKIAEAPERHARWRDGSRFRRCLLDQFPFVVFYETRADHIRILAFAHTSRRPGYWLGR